MKLKNISIENMNKDIKKEYEEKIHNLENIIESLKNKSITLQNENTNLKSKLQEEEEEELESSKSSHQHWIKTILVCFQYAFKIAEKGEKVQFTKTNISKNPNEKGAKIDILKEEIKLRMNGEEPTKTVVNLLKKAIPQNLRTPRGAPQK